MILVISSSQDEHAKMILARLGALNASAYLLDLARFPQQLGMALSYTDQKQPEYHLEEEAPLDLSQCRVIWWRRPQPFTLHADITDQAYRSFAYTECYEAFSGLWLALDAYWINHPSRDDDAGRKVYQLKVAQEVGLRIPDTLITNHPQQAAAFIDRHRPEATVYKAFSGTLEAWRETRVLRADELEALDSVRYAPVIFQEYIPANCDLRVTVIGQDIFAAAIYADRSSYPFDYRMDMSRAPVKAFQLPPDVIDKLHQLMARLGLVYGAIDMRHTPDGEFVFLEINPSGQWLFVEDRTGMPITQTLADLMVKQDV